MPRVGELSGGLPHHQRPLLPTHAAGQGEPAPTKLLCRLEIFRVLNLFSSLVIQTPSCRQGQLLSEEKNPSSQRRLGNKKVMMRMAGSHKPAGLAPFSHVSASALRHFPGELSTTLSLGIQLPLGMGKLSTKVLVQGHLIKPGNDPPCFLLPRPLTFFGAEAPAHALLDTPYSKQQTPKLDFGRPRHIDSRGR